MPQLDVGTFLPQVVWLLITFVAMFVIVLKLVTPSIQNVLEDRQRRIDEALKKAADLRTEAEAVLTAYEKALADARAAAHAALQKASEQVAQEAARREGELRERIGKTIAAGEASIARAKEQALAGIRGVALEAAKAVTERLVGRVADDAAVAGAVDRVLKSGR